MKIGIRVADCNAQHHDRFRVGQSRRGTATFGRNRPLPPIAHLAAFLFSPRAYILARPMTRARVLLLTAALGPLDYRVPYGSEAPLGSVVVVPLGPRRMGGVVWEDESFGAPEPVGDNRLRNLYEIVPVPPIAAPLRRLIEWTSDYYLAPPGSVLRMVLPGAAFADARRPIVEYRATGELPARMTPQRTVALEKIGTRQGLVRELAALAEVSEAVIRGLVNAGALEAVAVSADQPYPEPDPGFAPPDLSDEQTAAAGQLRDAVAAAAVCSSDRSGGAKPGSGSG